MDHFGTAATTDFVLVDEDSGEKRLERPRSARRTSQRRAVPEEPHMSPAESCVSPTLSTTSTVDDDEVEEFPPVLCDPVPSHRARRVLQSCTATPPDSLLLRSTVVDQRSRSSSRSPTSTPAAGGGLCLVDLAEARQRVLDRYDRKQRPPSSVSRRQNFADNVRVSSVAAGSDDCGGSHRRQQRLEPLTTVNVQAASELGVQHHR